MSGVCSRQTLHSCTCKLFICAKPAWLAREKKIETHRVHRKSQSAWHASCETANFLPLSHGRFGLLWRRLGRARHEWHICSSAIEMRFSSPSANAVVDRINSAFLCKRRSVAMQNRFNGPKFQRENSLCCALNTTAYAFSDVWNMHEHMLECTSARRSPLPTLTSL